MKMRRNLIVTAAAVFASVAFAAPVGAATPKPGTYSWQEEDEAVDVTVNDNRKTFDFVRVIVFCGPENDLYFITYDDPKGKDEKIERNGKFKVTNKVARANDETDTKKFTLEGKFTKSRKARFTLDVDGCGADRKGTLEQPPR